MAMYQSIPNLWKRDDKGTLIVGEFSDPIFESLYKANWTLTEKVDGTNIRLGFENEMFTVKGRTDRANLPTGLTAFCLSLEDEVRRLFNPDEDVTFYGEGYGKGIQKGEGYGNEQRFILFDVKIGKFWLRREDVAGIAVNLNIDSVPNLGVVKLKDVHKAFATTPYISRLRTPELTEGYVLRPVGDFLQRNGQPIRVKLKEVDYKRLR